MAHRTEPATDPNKAHPSNVTSIRVTYAEVDKMGVVYYGNYLRWFEIGRAEFLRARGKSYRQIEEEGFALPVIEAYARYRQSATYDDLVEIRTTPVSVGEVRVKFAYQIDRAPDGALLVEGFTVHACLGPKGRVRRFPPELIQLMTRC